jgi:hypothetical protein
MTFDLTKILQSKREFRKRLAARPIEEKLTMLDALRERTLAIHPMRAKSHTSMQCEQPPAYRTREKQSK